MTLFSSLWSEANGTNTPLFGDLWAGVSDTGVEALEPLFANGELGGYWPADPAYAYEDSAGTTPASVDGVVGYRTDVALGKHAVQATTANKPYLRVTPTTGKYWYDSNTATGALNVTFASALGRRNLLTYSEDFSNAAWTKTAMAMTAETAVHPCGVLAYKVKNTNDVTSWHYLRSANITITSGTTYTLSCSFKYGGIGFAYIQFAFGGIAYDGYLNLQTGAIAGGSAAVKPVIDEGDGFFRLSITATTVNATAGPVYIGYSTTYPVSQYTGDDASGVYTFGAQLELGSTPTDYQKIVAGPSAALDPAALAATYPQNISASTNCTIACVTPEGVVIADNQTVGTTFNICPPYGYNSDVLIINRALTPTEKTLVTRVMQRSVPGLGSNIAVNGSFATDTDWTKGSGWSIAGTAAKSAGTASNLTQTLGVSGNQYRVTADITRTAGTVGAYNGTAQIGATAATETAAKYAMKTTSTTVGFRADASFAGTIDNAVIQEIL